MLQNEPAEFKAKKQKRPLYFKKLLKKQHFSELNTTVPMIFVLQILYFLPNESLVYLTKFMDVIKTRANGDFFSFRTYTKHKCKNLCYMTKKYWWSV
jgi:hypothetical protein